MFLAVSEQELDALNGTDYSLTKLYLYLKQFMDFDTMIVGYKRRISYQSISEALYIEPRQGVKGGSPHISSIRRMLEQLIKCGLMKRSRKDTLVFKLVLADTSFYVQEKPDKKSTPIADKVKASNSNGLEHKPDRPKNAKADTPLNLINTIFSTTTTTKLLSTDQATAKSSSSNLIFTKSLDHNTQQAMFNLVKDFDTDMQQQLIDEVQGYIERGKVQSTPLALLYGMVERCKLGAFVTNYASKVKATREQRKQEQAKAVAPKTAKKDKPQSVVNLSEFLRSKKQQVSN